MKKSIILIAAYTGLLVALTFVIIACEETVCIGNGECTVFIEQGGSGLYIDNDRPRSTCGKSATYSSDLGKYTGGCKVQNNIENRDRKYGSHGCDC